MAEILDVAPVTTCDLADFKAEIYDLPCDVDLAGVLEANWKGQRKRAVDLQKCANVLRAKEMIWLDWARRNLPCAYGKTLRLPLGRWNEVVIDRSPPEESGALFRQIRAAM
eukprot:13646121-Alexandrium_andersonii.AAC.1